MINGKANISATSKIGEGTRVGDYAEIGENAMIVLSMAMSVSMAALPSGIAAKFNAMPVFIAGQFWKTAFLSGRARSFSMTIIPVPSIRTDRSRRGATGGHRA
jgi:hypothetical protein